LIAEAELRRLVAFELAWQAPVEFIQDIVASPFGPGTNSR
jgi:hypothetical protein